MLRWPSSTVLDVVSYWMGMWGTPDNRLLTISSLGKTEFTEGTSVYPDAATLVSVL